MARVRKLISIFRYLHSTPILVIIRASHNKNLISKYINREKYHADSVENPIRDLVLGECFDEVPHPSDILKQNLLSKQSKFCMYEIPPNFSD